MKRLLVVLIACLAVGASIDARADVVNGIDILSQSYSIHSEWKYGSPLVSGINDQSSTDGSPISFVMVSNPPWAWAVAISTSIDRFSFYNSAFADLAFLNGGMAWTTTNDQASWQFKPIGTALDVDLNIGEYNYFSGFAGIVVSLQDMTDPTTLLSIDSAALRDGWPSGTIDEDLAFAVDPTHIYQFSISAWSHIYDEDYAAQSVTATLTSAVPEPSVLWLLCIGLFGLYGGISLEQRRLKSA